MSRLLKLALCLVGVAGAWPCLHTLAADSDQGASFADEDKDTDGLTNGEEALYNTDLDNPNTDGDDKGDAEDGWAGDKDNSESNTEQAKLRPPRLPKPSYAGIVASKIPNSYKIWYVNGKGQAVVNDDPSNAYDHFYFWDAGATEGTPIPIPAPPTDSSYTPNQTITGLSENGTVIGTLFENDSHVKGMYEGDFSPRAFGWWWRPGDAAVTKLKEAPLTEDCETYWVAPWLIRGPLGSETVYANRYILGYIPNIGTGSSTTPYAGDVERYLTLKWNGLTAETPTDFTYERHDPLFGFVEGEVVNITDQTGAENPMKRQYLLDANTAGVSIGDRDLLKKYLVKKSRSGGAIVGSWTTTPPFEMPSHTDIPNQLASSIKDGSSLIDLDGDEPFDPLKGYAHRIADGGQVLGFRDDGSESMMWAKKTAADPYKPIILKGLTGDWAHQGYLNSRYEIAGGEKGASIAGASAPYIWRNYHRFPLLDLFPGLKDYSKLSVWGIDDRGIIKTVATLTKDAGKQQILLLSPTQIETKTSPYSNGVTDVGPINNIISVWPNQPIELFVNLSGIPETMTLPPDFIKWDVAGSTNQVAANQRRGTVVWPTSGTRQVVITVGGQKFRVVITVPDVGTNNQGAVINLHPVASVYAFVYSNIAVDSAATIFPDDPHNGGTGKANAYQHAYWNSLMASDSIIGSAIALEFSTSHEFNAWAYENGYAYNSCMDLHNNSVGVQEIHANTVGEPLYLECSQSILDRRSNGDLYIVAPEFSIPAGAFDRVGNIVKSNHVKVFPLK